jgi:hypothetical protein
MRSAFVVQSASHHALRALNYTPEVEAFRSKSGFRHVRLGSVLQSMGPAYGSVFTRIDCERASGVELITQGDMFAAEPEGRRIRMDSMARPERHRVRRWQILIAGAGTLGENELYGRAIIADGRLVDRFVGPHAMVLTFEDEGGPLNLYTYAFLCSSIGVKAVRAASFGTKILGVRKDVLSELPVPLADDETMKRVSVLIRRAVEQRERYAARLRTARGVVESLPAMRDAVAMCGTSRARCITWDGKLPTINAWTFASTGDALGMLSRVWKGRLGEVIPETGLFNGPRFARIPVREPFGIEFMSQRDGFLMKPVPRRIAHPGFSDKQLFVPRGSLLVGGHGTLGEGEIFGRCIYVTERLSRSAFTQDLLRLQPVEGAGPLVFAFLSTTVGFRLLRSCAVGTKILSLRPDLLRALPLPEVSAPDAKRVREAVEESCEAREEAERCEVEAVRIVEQEVLPKWLA